MKWVAVPVVSATIIASIPTVLAYRVQRHFQVPVPSGAIESVNGASYSGSAAFRSVNALRGTVSNVPSSDFLILVSLQYSPGANYQPANQHCVQAGEGKWEYKSFYIGSTRIAKPEEFAVFLFEGSPSAAQFFVSYNARKESFTGVSQLPPGLVLLDYIDGMRRS